MRTQPARMRRLVLVAGPVAGLALALAILALTRHAAAPGPAAPAGDVLPQPSTRLDAAGMSDLRMLRAVTGTAAARASATVEACLRRHGGEPVARRARIVRACAFRPLAGAGMAQTTNSMIVSSLRARLLQGRCLTMVSAYGVLLTAFGASAEEVVRTTGEWPPTHAAAASTARLGRWIARYSHRAAWSAACVPTAARRAA